MNSAIWTGLLIPLAGTALGSAFVFFLKKDMPEVLQKALLGFASGVMEAASVWSLLIPGMEMAGGNVWPVVIGLMAGFAFLLLIDYITPHLHPMGEEEGPRSRLSKTAKLALAVTIHNLPEGMAVGIVLAGALQSGAGMSVAGALALSLGIAIQNVPEGAIISMPLRAAGNSRWRSFWIGAASGAVEPVGGLLVILLASSVTPAMPYLLSFAAGAMLYVVVEELIPEASQGRHSNISTIGFAAGFALMMVLDVLLG
ncbi:MAG: ZIP family metal transporter [Bacteroidales bacterium]|nr:ZIP family metal transporter [Bacteroidales bacterium]